MDSKVYGFGVEFVRRTKQVAEINLSVFWFLFTAGLQSKAGGCVNFDGETLENTGTAYANNI